MVAFVGPTSVVVAAVIRMAVPISGAMHCGLLVVTSFSNASLEVGVTVLVQLSVSLDAGHRGRAVHGNRQRAPNWEQHCKEQQEPDAKRLHNS
jgi:hypothetical protein